MSNQRRKQGRKRLNMEPIRNQQNLQVSFSKRKSGVFKKSSELCTLTGTEMVIIIFSPGRKVHSFGHPNVDVVINRFLSGSWPRPDATAVDINELFRDAEIESLNKELTQMRDILDQKKARNAELRQKERTRQEEYWWERPVTDLNVQQLLELKRALERVEGTLATEEGDMTQLNLQPQQQYYYGGVGSS